MALRTPTSFAAALLAAACSTAPPTPLPPPVAIAATDYPGAAALLQGFTPAVQRNAWLVGETVLYALRLERGAEVKRWLVQLTLLDGTANPGRDGISSMTFQSDGKDPLTLMSPYLPFQVDVFDADGTPRGTSRVQVPYDFLRYSFLDASECERAGQTDLASHSTICGAHAALVSFLGILQNDPLLADILWQVVDKPGVLAIVASLGVTLRLGASLENARPAPTANLPGWPRPAIAFPLVLSLNGTRALDATITATDPWVPLRMGGGIVAVEATRPSDPSVRFSACLLAARAPMPDRPPLPPEPQSP
ncbi:MAG: hypothetical protein JNK15_21965 [Planctomycetes bacterium]|nr:hypothetical protein [Planctomycetota bacterium]